MTLLELITFLVDLMVTTFGVKALKVAPKVPFLWLIVRAVVIMIMNVPKVYYALEGEEVRWCLVVILSERGNKIVVMTHKAGNISDCT